MLSGIESIQAAQPSSQMEGTCTNLSHASTLLILCIFLNYAGNFKISVGCVN